MITVIRAETSGKTTLHKYGTKGFIMPGGINPVSPYGNASTKLVWCADRADTNAETLCTETRHTHARMPDTHAPEPQHKQQPQREAEEGRTEKIKNKYYTQITNKITK